MTALIHTLATLIRIGLVAAGSKAAKKVVAKIANTDRLRKARVHPIVMLAALKTYSQGHGGARREHLDSGPICCQCAERRVLCVV